MCFFGFGGWDLVGLECLGFRVGAAGAEFLLFTVLRTS